MPPDLQRYAKQLLFTHLGEPAQRRLLQSRVLICGCGALGSVLAETLARAGVGHIRLVDRDYVELSNLQRQVLYDEHDVAARLPKAVAAADKLRRINSQIEIEPVVADVNPSNARDLAQNIDLILDGTDNFEVRFLLNDLALETGIPWIYAGVIGSHGQTMTVIPGRTACLRCLIETVPEPGSMETCDTAGVLGPAVNVVASLEAVDALKFLSGQPELIDPVLTIVDVWDGSLRRMNLDSLRERANCPACAQGERRWLHGHAGSQTAILCGRNAVQVTPADRRAVDFDQLAAKLKTVGPVTANPWLLRLDLPDPPAEITLFRDGRAIIKGTDDPTLARTLYARYIGT